MRFSEPLCEFGPKGVKDVIDEFSSQPGAQGASSSQDKTCRMTPSMILLEKNCTGGLPSLEKYAGSRSQFLSLAGVPVENKMDGYCKEKYIIFWPDLNGKMKVCLYILMIKMFICNANCAILTFLILIFISFKAFLTPDFISFKRIFKIKR